MMIVSTWGRYIQMHKAITFFYMMVLLTFSAICSESAEFAPQSARGLTLQEVVRSTLALQSNISLSKEQLVQSDAAITLTRAEFDWTLESKLNHGADYLPTGASSLYDRILTTTFDTRLVKKIEYGFSIEPGLQIKRAATEPSGLSSETGSTVRLSFALVVPLLQGAGKTAVTAQESAARFDYEAARFELRHTVSQTVYDAIVAYWHYVAAAERQKLAVVAEERAGNVVANTEALVNADEVPQAELVNARANQLEKKMSREHAELTLLEAQQNMGLLMGIVPDESSALPLPAGRLPVVGQSTAQRARENRQQIIAGAERRGDLRSLIQKTHAADSTVIAAKDALDPKLDLVSGIGYDGYLIGNSVQTTLRTLENRQKFPDWSVGLRFSYPLENNRAAGNYAIASSRQAQAGIRVRELQRSVETSLRTIVQSMQNVAREIETADRAVVSYQQAVDNEKEKYLMGESTLFDLLFTQDKLELSQLTRTDANLSGALLLTRLQFESGNLLTCSEDACEFNPDVAALFNSAWKEAN